jgi:hypothetical protein
MLMRFFVSTNILRHMEFTRITVVPMNQNVVDNTELDEEEANATMDGQLISSLVVLFLREIWMRLY